MAYPPVQEIPQLTRRQLEFLSLRAQGLTNREIAERCYVHNKTVEHTLAAACERLGTRFVLHAILRCITFEILILTGDSEVLIPEHLNALAA
jgi:DNA-binding NarL/FixJ family response regulator